MEYDVSLYRSYTFELGTNGILKACIEGTALARMARSWATAFRAARDSAGAVSGGRG